MALIERSVLVLSGNRDQFKDCVAISGEEDSFAGRTYYVDGSRLEAVCGMMYDKVIVYGTFWEKKDAGELYKIAMAHCKEKTSVCLFDGDLNKKILKNIDVI